MISRDELYWRLAMAAFMAAHRFQNPQAAKGTLVFSQKLERAMTEAVAAEIGRIVAENPPVWTEIKTPADIEFEGLTKGVTIKAEPFDPFQGGTV